MKKEETIRRYGEITYQKEKKQGRERHAKHREGDNERSAKWRETHPGEVIAQGRDRSHKGGKYYDKTLEYLRTSLQYKRNLVRHSHRRKWNPFKRIIAPESQIHHQWVPGTANYTGVALVEKDQHMHGFIDVIQILEGEIMLRVEYIEIPMEGVR